jgi:penicillin-binding protein 1C
MKPLKLITVIKHHIARIGWKTLTGWLLLAGAAGMLAIFLVVAALSYNLPSVEQINSRQMSQSTKIFDRKGEVVLYEISDGEKRTVVPYEEIPQTVKDATIAIEDQDFYTGPAFSIKGILRAVWANVTNRGGRLQGGSTITQQLARNAFLTLDQTWSRKVRELILAIQLSRHYSKDKILWMYLNEIDYGPNISGVGTASKMFFNKSINEVSLAEAALLAATPQAPSYFSPWGSHTDELFARQKTVLRRMKELGKISETQYDEAIKAEITFQPQSTGIKAPHFILTLQDYLVKRYGEDMVRRGGLHVISTLDWDLQQVAEKAVRTGAERNEKLYKGKNAALVAEDPKTGQILALVGSRDYFDIKNQGNFNVATLGLRQPGSALKPFVYLQGFLKGYLPQTVLFDVPTEFVPNNPKCPVVPDFKTTNTECFHPQNYDGDFRGPVNIKSSLAQSINIPAVKMLYLVGMKNALALLQDFGLTTLDDPSRFGLALVLGGGEVKMIDMMKAYSTLAQDGVRREQSLVLEVRDSSGEVLEAFENKEQRVIDPQYVRMINDILSDGDARAGLFHGSLGLTLFGPHEVALKTGTTNDYHDAWAMGYTPSIAVGVWAGNNDNMAMQKQGGSILAAVPIWSEFMKEALKKLPPEPFTRPEPVNPEKPVLGGAFVVDNQIHDILYYVSREDPTGPRPNNPFADPQFENWEYGVAAWAARNGHNYTGGGSNGFDIRITSPAAGLSFQSSFQVEADITAPQPLTAIRILYNGAPVQEFRGEFSSPYHLSWNLSPQNSGQQNLLEIEAVLKDNSSKKSQVIVFWNP